MRFHNTKIYGLNESIKSSNYPMRTDIIFDYDDVTDSDIKRARNLGTTKAGSGHDCYLKGIIVQYDLTAPAYIWPQFQRYHFQDIISSQSKMHKIEFMNIDTQCNQWVLEETKNLAKKLVYVYVNSDWETDKTIIWEDGNAYNKEEFYHVLISNLPQGLELTARITTNYLQLKTIYNQRKNHKLFDWSSDFVHWCTTLEKFMELTNK